MNEHPLIVSYFTKNTLYEKDAARLRLSCERFGLPFDIEGIEPFGKWHEHVCYKPLFILKKLKELKRPLLWIDADGEIVEKLPSLAFDCDISLRTFNHFPKDHPCHLYAATAYVDYSPNSLSLIEAWAEGCQEKLRANPGLEVSDQVILNDLLQTSKARFKPLPPPFAALFDENLPRKYIVQHQASRLYRKIINQELAFGIFDHLSIEQLDQLKPRL